MKSLCLGLLLASMAASHLLAQGMSGGDPFPAPPTSSDVAPSPEPSADNKKPGAPQTTGSTTIDSMAMDYDEKTRIVIFTGDNYGVTVVDPQFTINCNKVTAYLRQPGESTPGASPKGKAAASPKLGVPHTPAPKPAASPSSAAPKQSSFKRAVAEGTRDQPVVIVQDKPASPGQEAQHSVGIAEKADYNADTGDIKLTGWPRVTQGINTQIATSSSTYMIMNKNGGKMHTFGPSHSVFEQDNQPKKSGANSASPSPQ